jgi:HEAT repeat protein
VSRLDRELASLSEPEILAALETEGPESERRCGLLRRLQRIGTAASVDALRKSLASPSEKVRVAAFQALAHIHTVGAVDAMIEALDADDADTVGWAAYFLRRIGARRAVPSLIRCAEERRDDGTDKTLLIQSLAHMPDPLAIPVLRAYATDPRWLTRREAALALRAIGTPESRTALEQAAAELSWVRAIPARRALRPRAKTTSEPFQSSD